MSTDDPRRLRGGAAGGHGGLGGQGRLRELLLAEPGVAEALSGPALGVALDPGPVRGQAGPVFDQLECLASRSHSRR